MIIDKIRFAGKDSYFQDNAGNTNLSGTTAKTKFLGKGKQLEVSAIELLIESDNDLTDLFNLQNQPLFSVLVVKEVFPSLFADPFQHRVHTIAGFDDFKRGKFENCKVLDIEGIPTIVSIGTKTSIWTSPMYQMPEQVSLAHASWELAASRKTPNANFKYSITLKTFDANKTEISSTPIAANLDPTKLRKYENLNLQNVAFYQFIFEARVKKDAAIYEKHSVLIGESIGTPLLRAVNLLEPIESIYNIYSLQELLSLCSEYHLFEFQGQPIKKMLATLDLSAVLVQSEAEDIANDKYESIEIKVVNNNFKNFEAKLISEVLLKIGR